MNHLKTQYGQTVADGADEAIRQALRGLRRKSQRTRNAMEDAFEEARRKARALRRDLQRQVHRHPLAAIGAAGTAFALAGLLIAGHRNRSKA